MNAFEAAIRNALERSDRTNPEVRARIYQSARQALEAGLRKQGISDAATISAQRRKLEQLIASVEAGEQLAVEAQASRSAAGQRIEPGFSAAPMGQSGRAEPRREPGFSEPEPDDDNGDDEEDFSAFRDDRGAGVPNGEMIGGGAVRRSSLESVVAGREGRVAKPRRKRGVFARLFIYFIILVSLVMGGGWLYMSGALMSPAERDTSVPNPPPRVVEEDVAGHDAGPRSFDPQGGFSGDWVEVFSPANAARLKVGAAAKVDSMVTASGPAIRITSSRTGKDGDVRVDVPVDVLSQMAGKTSTVALTMQSATSDSADVSVQCEFGSLGNCDRHRFTAAQEKFDALFKVTLPRALTPNAPGSLVLNTGLGEAGRSIDLFSIRILPGE